MLILLHKQAMMTASPPFGVLATRWRGAATPVRVAKVLRPIWGRVNQVESRHLLPSCSVA